MRKNKKEYILQTVQPRLCGIHERPGETVAQGSPKWTVPCALACASILVAAGTLAVAWL